MDEKTEFCRVYWMNVSGWEVKSMGVGEVCVFAMMTSLEKSVALVGVVITYFSNCLHFYLIR
jgi:hypothetical protein